MTEHIWQGVGVDPATDLAVVCSNCHRIIHRRAKRPLTVTDLRRMIADASAADS